MNSQPLSPSLAKTLPKKSGIQGWLYRRWLYRLSVGQKIGWGYGLALGMALVGTWVGMEIGDYYLWQAWQLEEHSRQEADLLHNLQTELLQVLTQKQKLLLLTNQRQQFQQEYAQLLQQQTQVRSTWKVLQTFVDSQKHINHPGNRIHREELPNFLVQYASVPQIHAQTLDGLAQDVIASHSGSSEAQSVSAQRLLEFAAEDKLSHEFEKSSIALTLLVKRSAEDHALARATYDSADILRLNIVLSSMAISTVIAVVLAFFTSRTIVRPLKTVTEIVKTATQQSDFNGQAPVTSADEVGILALSFNHLIQHVNQVTQELYQKNQCLEHTLQELKRTEAQMIQQEKMSSLGQMVAGVAHEINNPVNFIHANISHAETYIHELLELISLYQKFYPQPSIVIQDKIASLDLDFLTRDLSLLLKSMNVGTARIQNIVLALRNFSRLDEADLKTVDIHEGINSTLMLLERRFQAQENRPEITLIKDYGILPNIECYPGQLNQVLMNLLNNAIDAIDAHNDADQPPQITIRTTVLKKDRIAIHILDNGIGMTEAVQAKIFDPFFTTKPVGKGTGLGLALSYPIVVEQHNGKLFCQSQVGQGTEFTLEVPVHLARCVP